MKYTVFIAALFACAFLSSCSSGESHQLVGTWHIDTLYVDGGFVQGNSPATTNMVWTITENAITETSDAGTNKVYTWELDIDSLYLTNGGQVQAYFIQELTDEKLELWWVGNYLKATRHH